MFNPIAVGMPDPGCIYCQLTIVTLEFSQLIAANRKGSSHTEECAQPCFVQLLVCLPSLHLQSN